MYGKTRRCSRRWCPYSVREARTASLHDIAFLALAPVYSYTVGGADEGQTPPAGGWQKWLDGITTEQAGDMKYYEVCAQSGVEGAVKLFCDGGASLRKNPSLAFQNTLKAAQAGYVPAEEVVGMMYATGKGVQQDYTEAGKWFLSAAEKGEYRAAVHYAGDLRDGESPLRRNTELAGSLGKVCRRPSGVRSPAAPAKRRAEPRRCAATPGKGN